MLLVFVVISCLDRCNIQDRYSGAHNIIWTSELVVTVIEREDGGLNLPIESLYVGTRVRSVPMSHKPRHLRHQDSRSCCDTVEINL